MSVNGLNGDLPCSACHRPVGIDPGKSVIRPHASRLRWWQRSAKTCSGTGCPPSDHPLGKAYAT